MAAEAISKNREAPLISFSINILMLAVPMFSLQVYDWAVAVRIRCSLWC